MHAVRVRLKAATHAAHRRVEVALGLETEPTRERLADALVRLHGFWRPTEAAADAWATRSPELAARLDWPRRRRSVQQRADLDELGVRPDAIATYAGATVVLDADLLGWLYVAEGSTLGGAVVGRALASTGLPVPRSFAPYPEGPGPMWRAYLDVLDDWAGADELRHTAVVAAATSAFGELADWVEAARLEGVA